MPAQQTSPGETTGAPKKEETPAVSGMPGPQTTVPPTKNETTASSGGDGNATGIYVNNCFGNEICCYFEKKTHKNFINNFFNRRNQ